MDSEGAIRGQPSAISSDAADPLANARCPQCGYSLRGLPENRCPECGRAFDPAEFTGTFLPRWPQLMAWYLAAYIIAKMLNLSPALLRWNPYLLLALKTGDEPLKNITNICHLTEVAVLCLFGPICIIGLYRRRDWARKGCIIIFALTVLAWLSYLAETWQDGTWTQGFSEAIRSLWFLLGFVPEGPSAALVALFMLTGLRRRSLGCRRGIPAAMLPWRHFRPKHDWLLLAAVILIGLGVGWIWAAGSSLDAMQQWLRAVGVTGRAYHPVDLYIIALKGRITLGLSAMAAACLIWLCPSWLRQATGAVLAAALGVRVFEFIVYWRRYWPDHIKLVCDVMTLTATVMPYLALALFAFLAISREDIQRLTVQE